MNINMKKGFTMIELVFVIVIIGILSSVALPKLLDTANRSHDAKINSFVGTLNRTTGPTLWATSLHNSLDGDITSYCVNMENYMTFIKELTNDGDCTFTVKAGEGSTYQSIEFVNGTALVSPSWNIVK